MMKERSQYWHEEKARWAFELGDHYIIDGELDHCFKEKEPLGYKCHGGLIHEAPGSPSSQDSFEISTEKL